MDKNLLQPEVQEFLEKNHQEDPRNIALKASPFPELSPSELAIQVAGKKKALKKLPSWFQTRGIIYPPSLNLEQTSSELTGDYKASLVSGSRLADLTGGFGIDVYHFSKKVDTVYHCERNKALSELAAHNLSLLGAKNVKYVVGDGLEFISDSLEIFDWIYIDPSRRADGGGRVFQLEDCEPNVPEHLDFLLSKCKNLLLKTAPLLDIQAGLRELNQVEEIQVIAVRNEVKELLWILGNPAAPVNLKTVNFTATQTQVFEAPLIEMGEAVMGSPQRYLYEPNAAIMKSGLFASLGSHYNLRKLHPNTHLFTSDDLVEFPGRRFKVMEQHPYNKKKIKKVLSGTKANVTTRNFPDSVAQLRKQFKLKDGGDTYLFFTCLNQEERVVLVCERI